MEFVFMMRRLAKDINKTMNRDETSCAVQDFPLSLPASASTLAFKCKTGDDQTVAALKTIKGLVSEKGFMGKTTYYVPLNKLIEIVNTYKPDSLIDLYIKSQQELIAKLQEVVMGIKSKDKVLQQMLELMAESKKNNLTFNEVIDNIKPTSPQKEKIGLFKSNKEINQLCSVIRNADPDDNKKTNHDLSKLANAQEHPKPKKQSGAIDYGRGS